MSNKLQELAYKQSSAMRGESTKCFLAVLSYFGIPETMADVGCGEGHLVRLAAQMGISSFGIDSNLPENVGFENGHLYKFDLARYRTFIQYEMVFCLEVAEHLPENAADNLCRLLSEMTKGILIFSAAQPGQGGAGHLNEQPPVFWRRKLEMEGLVWYPTQSEALADIWKTIARNAWWYSKNCQVFKCAK